MASWKISFTIVMLSLVVCALAADKQDKKLKCYQCNDCKEAKKDDLKECPAGLVCAIVGIPDKENWLRSCAPDNICDTKDIKDQKDVKCSTCKEDECNGSYTMSASFGVVTIALAMVLRYAH